ncbi:hypothetical protein L210DRAFT_3506615 [Boletus edulis BED1]|uniref:Uncharacterized protein n=1 Tax=Boletus edulis BED1 TaxID=1328754 RepID=A0AAD4BMX3_BOLED|nr:hypothetical protein L210DRAFT_3506615 [Boletus edulis BED1]
MLSQPAISRSKLGKRSALELCSPLLESVASLIPSVSPLSTREQGRLLTKEVASLVKCLSSWALEVTDANGLHEIKRLLRELLDMTVVNCAPSIQASLAVRVARGRFPRFFVAPPEEKEWQGGVEAMFAVELSLKALGESPEDIPWKPTSFVDVIYLAHSTTPLPLSPSSRSDLYHLLVNALQMNMVLDEALYLLFLDFTRETMIISPELVPSLCTVLSALASTHLDPTIRQLCLRLLSLTLTKLPPPPRLEILMGLTTDEDFPQIRGPAVGLLKETVLEALALPQDSASRNPFASSELLRIFGGVLFRPNPPEFFGKERLEKSLRNCLSFYFVLLHRDRENRTGVRSKCNVMSIQKSFLQPLRQFLDDHIAGEVCAHAERPLMAISSLQVGLDRINHALQTLDLDKDT